VECEAMGHALGYAFIYGGKSVSACSQTAYVRTSYARTATVTPITATEAQDPAQENPSVSYVKFVHTYMIYKTRSNNRR
jgi:hypothetical protein